MTATSYETLPGGGVTLDVKVLVSARISAGFSQSELARRAGLSQGHISELERGDKNPRPATLKKLAAALSVPVAALVPPEACADA